MQKKRRKQLMFHDWPSGFHGARLFQDNRWVKLAEIIPWDFVEEEYTKAFTKKANGQSIDRKPDGLWRTSNQTRT
jgi:transposase, IS5 family